MPFDFGEAEDDPVIRAEGSAALPASWGAGVDTFIDTKLDNLTAGLFRVLDQDSRTWLARHFGDAVEPGGAMERSLSRDEAQQQYGADGLVTFNGAVAESVARERRDLAMRQARRSAIYERADLGLLGNVLGFGGAVAASVLDPAQVAAAFTPIAGARYARWLEAAGTATRRAGVRLGVGAAEGLAGSVALEPLAILVNSAEGRDYSAADSLLNITVGTVLGGGLHTAIGSVAEWTGAASYARPARVMDVGEDGAVTAMGVGEGPRGASSMLERVRRADAETRLEAIETALAQSADGDMVDVAPVYQRHEARRAAAADASEARLPDLKLARAEDAPASAFTPAGRRIGVRYGLAELDDLVTSHDDALTINPFYPAALQPRDRTRLASAAQIERMARALEPGLLMRSATAGDGAPIVSAKGVVESGNARTIALRKARELNPEGVAAYRAALKAEGFDPDGMTSPVLVRVREDALDGGDRIAFTREANERSTAALSAPEQALADAGAISDATLALHRGGSTLKAENRDFVKAAIRAMAGDADQAAFFTRDGGLSADGQMRLDRAILARAYGDGDLIALMTEGGMEDMRSIGGALLDQAPGWAQMRRRAADGTIRPEADQTEALVAAVHLVRRARREDRALALYLKTDDMFAGGISPEVQAFAAIFFSDGGLTKAAPRVRIEDALNYYRGQAELMQPGPSLFGDTDGGSPFDIIAQALARRGGAAGGEQLQLAGRADGAEPDGAASRGGGGEPRSSDDGGTAAADRQGEGGGSLKLARAERFDLVDGTKAEQNPSPRALLRLLKQIEAARARDPDWSPKDGPASLRGLAEPDRTVWWDAWARTHADVARELDMTYSGQVQMYAHAGADTIVIDLGDNGLEAGVLNGGAFARDPTGVLSLPAMQPFLSAPNVRFDIGGVAPITAAELRQVLADTARADAAAAPPAKVAPEQKAPTGGADSSQASLLAEMQEDLAAAEAALAARAEQLGVDPEALLAEVDAELDLAARVAGETAPGVRGQQLMNVAAGRDAALACLVAGDVR